NGTVQLNGFSNGLFSRSAILLLAGAGPQTLGGTGQVLLAGDFGIAPAPGVNVLTVSNTSALTLDTGVSVVNTGNGDGGTLGNPSAPLTINGTVTASGGRTIALAGATVTNNGMVQAIGGGSLTLLGATSINQSGSLAGQASASITAQGNLVGSTVNAQRYGP